MTVIAIILTCAGLLIGSFLGLVSLRLPAGRGFVAGRSRCGGCDRPLGPRDLMPVVSFLASRGRCRTCAAPIPRRYPLIEAAAAGLGLWAGLSQATPLAAGLTALLAWQLLLIAVVDAEHFWLPDRLTLPLGAAGLAATALLAPEAWPHAVIGMGVGYAGLQLIRLVYRATRGREGMGGGDPILFGAIGAWVGWIGLPSVLVWAAASGLSLALALFLVRRRAALSDRLPFGVFLAVGAWMVWLFGPIGG